MVNADLETIHKVPDMWKPLSKERIIDQFDPKFEYQNTKFETIPNLQNLNDQNKLPRPWSLLLMF